MQRLLIILLSIIFAFSTVGCSTASKKRDKAIAVGIYQVNQSLKQGRVDLAKKYSDQLVRVVAPPKKLPVIHKVEIKQKDGSSNQYIVLPLEYSGTPALTIGTKPFEEAVAQSAELRKQLATEEKEIKKFEATVDNSIRATVKQADKDEKRTGMFGWLMGTLGVLGIGGIIGLIVLCALFPALIPIVVNLFGSVMAIANQGLSAVARLWKRNPPA